MLGRDPSWRGRHPDYGSANTLFVLDNTYLELLAAEGSGWAGDRVTQHIADKGQGLMGLVFGVDEIGPFIDHTRKAGLDISDPLTGHEPTCRDRRAKLAEYGVAGRCRARHFQFCHSP